VFVAGVCGAQDTSADYIAWGHTTLVNPWGEILAKAEFKEETLIADIGKAIFLFFFFAIKV
jgi:omega-amidase